MFDSKKKKNSMFSNFGKTEKYGNYEIVLHSLNQRSKNLL